MRVTISRRDTADTAITVKSLLDHSLHLQSSSPTPGTVSPGTEVDSGVSSVGKMMTISITKYGSTLYMGKDEILAHYACTF